MATDEDLTKFNDTLTQLRNKFTPTLFETLFKGEDKDNSGYLEKNEIIELCQSAMEQLFEDKSLIDAGMIKDMANGKINIYINLF